jgi:transposase-like protein
MENVLPACPLRTKLPRNVEGPCAPCLSTHVIRKGFFLRPNGRTKVQRYACKSCRGRFSERTLLPEWRQKKPHKNEMLRKLLMTGVSQRGAAFVLGISRITVARRIPWFARLAREANARHVASLGPREILMFDEMISFEHSNWKQLSLPIVVDEETQSILAVGVARIPCSGPNAQKAYDKYGPRPTQVPAVLRAVLGRVAPLVGPQGYVMTDRSKAYPDALREVFPQRLHVAFPSRKACVVGQGEMKEGGWDPLFMLNHAYAMIRDHLCTLHRATWCTTKRPDRLHDLLDIYAWWHNGTLLPKRRAEKETRLRNKQKKRLAALEAQSG